MRELFSPNRDARPPGRRPELVILHYTGMPDAGSALRRLRDPAAKVSAHYLLDEDGGVCRLVPEDLRAWHAGRSFWAGQVGLNDVSIGVELVNPGHEWGYRPFPGPQVAALEALLGAVLGRWRLGPDAVLGHSDVACDRKQDPGELFPWERLAARGLALQPALPAGPAGDAPPAAEAPALLAAIGYGPPDLPAATLLAAFQRRHRPARIDGLADEQTLRLLAALAALLASPALARGRSAL